jgi:hypothetical protein
MELTELGLVGVDWIDLAQDWVQWRALVNTVMNLRAPYNLGKFLSGCATGDLSRRAELREVHISWAPRRIQTGEVWLWESFWESTGRLEAGGLGFLKELFGVRNSSLKFDNLECKSNRLLSPEIRYVVVAFSIHFVPVSPWTPDTQPVERWRAPTKGKSRQRSATTVPHGSMQIRATIPDLTLR